MNYDSFSHGQILSKIWLCEQLEPHVPKNTKAAILGSWYNVLAFMMLTRRSDLYQFISGIDHDHLATDIADKICNAWIFGDNPKVTNITSDVSEYDYIEFNLVINCSVEHMSNEWFLDIDPNVIVCIQTSNVADSKEPWFITNPTASFEEFRNKFPMSETMFEGVRSFDYGHFSYERYMIIGKR